MAEEEAVSVTLQAPIDHPHKRKLEDLELPSSDAPDTEAAPDSTFEVDKDEEKGEDENGDAEVSEPAKRPRLDEGSDGLANENGHKLEEDNGHAVENAETITNNQVGNNEPVNEAPEGVDATQAVSESEQILDAAPANSEGKDVQDDNCEGKDAEIPSSDKEQSDNVEKLSGDTAQMPATGQENAASDQHHSESGTRTTTRKIEIPNNKVGVLIGKAGDTIKYLQINSGAKIQITRDADADPRAPTRPIELVGTVESLNKAESLIKDVIAEADAGGSPSLIARGFTATMTSGSAEIEMPVPSDKVGLIIGRGGETIRSLQTRSGARIQLIPQTSPGDQSKEKKVKVTGDKKQVEMAIELIKEVMNQLPVRPSQFSGNNYNQQQGYRPRGPPGAPSQWGARGPAPAQPMPPYDGHQRGPYPSQGHHYPPQPYGYPQPRGSFGGPGGWDNNRPSAQGPPPHHHSGGGYDYYGQANAPSSGPQPTHMPGHHASGPPSSMAPPHSQGNYSYGQPPRGTDYPQPTPYPQTGPPAQGYGHGYGEPKYDNQGHVNQSYGGQGYPPQQQQGGYAPPQQQQGYAPPQQQYHRPPQPYGVPSQGAPPPTQGYGAPTPTASQPPTDGSAYQAPPVSGAPQPYAQPQQQPYPQAPYGSAPMANTDAYGQPQPAVAASYPQQPGAPPAAQYGQQPAGYAQAAGPTAGYGQYPQAAAQPGYADPSATGAQTAATYGYPGQVDPSQAAYGAAGQAYAGGPAAVAQQGYAQPGYDQAAAAAQSGGYASAPVATAYGKTTVSPQPQPQPQPGYAPQYDASQQMYAAPPR